MDAWLLRPSRFFVSKHKEETTGKAGVLGPPRLVAEHFSYFSFLLYEGSIATHKNNRRDTCIATVLHGSDDQLRTNMRCSLSVVVLPARAGEHIVPELDLFALCLRTGTTRDVVDVLPLELWVGAVVELRPNPALGR